MSGFVPSEVDVNAVIETRSERAKRKDGEGLWTAIILGATAIWIILNQILGS